MSENDENSSGLTMVEFYKSVDVVNHRQAEAAHQYEIARWLFASLIAINGGAILVIIQTNLAQGIALIAMTPFPVGIVAAIVSAMLAESSARASNEFFANLLLDGALRDELRIDIKNRSETQDELKVRAEALNKSPVGAHNRKSRRYARHSSIASIVSLTLFIVGCVCVGLASYAYS